MISPHEPNAEVDTRPASTNVAGDPDDVAGDLLLNPTTGERFRFLETEENLARVDWWLRPGGRSPLHFHPHQVERATALSGELEIRFRDRTFGNRAFTVRAGESLSVPAGVVHEFHNTSNDDVHMIVDFIPALDMKPFFEAAAGLAYDGKTDDSGRPKSPLLLGEFAWGFRRVFGVPSPPRFLQRLVLPILAAMARRRGLAATDQGYERPFAPHDESVERAVLAARALKI